MSIQQCQYNNVNTTMSIQHLATFGMIMQITTRYMKESALSDLIYIELTLLLHCDIWRSVCVLRKG
jgi:hypothetical protein